MQISGIDDYLDGMLQTWCRTRYGLFLEIRSVKAIYSGIGSYMLSCSVVDIILRRQTEPALVTGSKTIACTLELCLALTQLNTIGIVGVRRCRLVKNCD